MMKDGKKHAEISTEELVNLSLPTQKQNVVKIMECDGNFVQSSSEIVGRVDITSCFFLILTMSILLWVNFRLYDVFSDSDVSF